MPNQVDLLVGSNIRRRRELLGVDEWSLARSVGVTARELREYEEGTRPAPDVLAKIAKELGVDVGYFFTPLIT